MMLNSQNCDFLHAGLNIWALLLHLFFYVSRYILLLSAELVPAPDSMI